MDPQARETERAPLDPETLRWFAPAVATEDPGLDAGRIAHAFRIGEYWFLIPMDLPAEVSPPLFLARLPFTKPWCLGLANFRGELVPVYDLGALLAGGGVSARGYFLVLGERDARAALRIDEITVIRLAAEASAQLQPPWPGLPEDLILRGLDVEGIRYAELDLGGLLSRLARHAGRL
ncbi:chemotaxis protein CheW [Thiocystis violacea]|uniref:chemotaxis protein CheW n=1 Tax=Thiocystis violacea TaxID=13725 RepID=UPI0019034F8C|nr:chemotaxis protein CheW [Thiocystis violacea]MBK1716423.1 hypothetical protein [Thiocystis violacea]